jgi:hypothetical protein
MEAANSEVVQANMRLFACFVPLFTPAAPLPLAVSQQRIQFVFPETFVGAAHININQNIL